MAELSDQLASLEAMSSAQLRRYWRHLTGGPIPKVSPSMLRLALAWELQAKVHGGVSRAVQQRLDQLARGMTRTSCAQPGMRLVREWGAKRMW